jgi:hypothetical protein
MTIYATPHGTATPNPYAARIAATEGASVVTCCNHNCNEGRTCPLRVRRRLTIKPLVMEILAAIAGRKDDE